MPTMEEIYQRHSAQYDELVDAEDYQGNLRAWLRSAVDWRGRRVLEAGAGTGRVTEIYVAGARSATCLDRSAHMLQAARRRLAGYLDRITFMVADNASLPQLPDRYDAFIEGWSFGHSVMDAREPVEEVARRLLAGACRNLTEAAEVVLIETMGTNTEGPRPPAERLAEFYQCLETRHGFRRAIIETDYRFPSVARAAEAMGFFFGPEMRELVESRQQTVIPEWTGAWRLSR